MKRILLSALILGGLAQAQALLEITSGLPSPASAAFVGDGDVIPCGGNCVYWGLRAFSAATTGTRLVNVCIPADAACADLVSDSSGNLVITTIGGMSCSVVTCTIKIFYDPTGAMLCSGPCDISQPAISQRLVLMPAGLGSLPIATDSGSQFGSSPVLGASLNQPFSISSVGERTGSTSSFGDLTANASAVQLGFNNSPNSAFIFGGSLPSVTANDSVFHAFQSLFNGASSLLNVDGTVNAVSAGTNAATAQFAIASPNLFTGNFLEAVWWGGDKSASFATLNSNQHAYWGF
jgi:hypothetical protein